MLSPSGKSSQLVIKINGDTPGFMSKSVEVIVETTVHQPSVATVTVHDPGPKFIDQEQWLGDQLQVGVMSGSGQGLLFDGDIVEVGIRFESQGPRMVIVAFDRLHLLGRITKTQAFNNLGFSDIVNQMVQDVNQSVTNPKVKLSANVNGVDQSYPYIVQNNETHLAFLQRLAAPLGCLVYMQGNTLNCVLPPGVTSGSSGGLMGSLAGAALGALGLGGPELKWGSNLHEFYPRVTTINQLNKVTVRGWDPDQQQEVVGKSGPGQGDPQIGQTKSGDTGGDTAKKVFGISSEMVVSSTLRDQDDADDLAQAVLDHTEGQFVTAEGSCAGMPQIIAGQSVTVKSVGGRFSGTYFITSARHIYHENYTTEFSISGYDPWTLAYMLGRGKEARITAPPGLSIAIVTNIDDPDKAGRVKLRYPWLESKENGHAESDWARIVAPGGGNQYGIQFHPEVNDEVLVGFELGDFQCPYVLGGLWSSQATPPQPEHTNNGQVEKRVIYSRTGHTITLDDSDDGSGITIQDSQGNTVALDSKNNKLTITSKSGDLTLEAPQGKVQITAQSGITIDSGSGDVKVTGGTISLN